MTSEEVEVSTVAANTETEASEEEDAAEEEEHEKPFRCQLV
ncbi:MAG: hypothetical protein ABFC77_10595 [Thermoguttaceae bacterium]